MKKFEVEVILNYTAEVYAYNEDEAKDLAVDEALDMGEFSAFAYEINSDSDEEEEE